MNKAVKVSMIGFCVALALFILAVTVFVSVFDINDYKERIVQVVHDATGRTVLFHSDIKLQILPKLGVELGGVSLSNAKGFGDAPMVRADHARVEVRILPLLKGDIAFGQLVLEGLTLNLSRNEDGVVNWHDLVGRKEASGAVEVDESEPFALDIEGVDVQKASLVWDDRLSGTTFTFRNIDLKTGTIYRGAPFPVQGRFEFGCSHPTAEGEVEFSGKSSIDLVNREYGHMDMKLSIAAQGTDVPGGQGRADASVQFAVLDFNKEHAQITGLVVTTYGATVRVDGSLEGLTSGLAKAVGTVSVDPFDCKKSLTMLGVEGPSTSDDKALTKVGGMAEVAYEPGDLHLKTMQANVDGSSVTGRIRLRLIDGKPFQFVRLDVGEVDLDRYLPSRRTEKMGEGVNDAGSAKGAERLFDTRLLRRLWFDWQANVARLRIAGAWSEQVHLSAKAENGLIRISPVEADLYGGTLSSSLTADATEKSPRFNLILGLDRVDIGALSRDRADEQEYAGHLDFNSALSCSGDSFPALLNTMSGKIGFDLSDGVFPGVDLKKMARDAHASKEEKGGRVEPEARDKTDFGSITGTGVIKAGILENDDLEIKAPGLRADGEGVVSLPTRQVNYLVKAKLVATRQGQGGESSKDLYGILVPVRVGGTLDNPKYWVSLTEYIKALGGAVLSLPGTILGGVKDAILGVGKVVSGECCEDDTQERQPEKKKRGLFNIF